MVIIISSLFISKKISQVLSDAVHKIILYPILILIVFLPITNRSILFYTI